MSKTSHCYLEPGLLSPITIINHGNAQTMAFTTQMFFPTNLV